MKVEAAMEDPLKRATYAFYLFLISNTLVPAFAHGAMYQWTDNNGNLMVTDDLSKVPQEYRQKQAVPANNVNVREKREIEAQQYSPTATDGKPKSKMREIPSASSSAGFSIASPSAGARVDAGSSITVRVDPQSVGPLAEVLFIAAGADGRLFGNGMSPLPPYTWTFSLPKDYSGPVVIHAAGHVLGQATGTPPEATVTITAALPARVLLTEVIVREDLYLLVMRPGMTDRLYIYGTYSDGIKRDISGSAKGTTYSSNSETVATVDADGTITARGVGKALITIKNQEKQVQSTVMVRQ